MSDEANHTKGPVHLKPSSSFFLFWMLTIKERNSGREKCTGCDPGH